MSEPTKILVIDDSEDDRLLYRRCLQKMTRDSYAIIEAINGEDGVAHIQKTAPACVLLDYSMPGRNGVEVLKRIRAKYPFVPVVMLTGQGNEKVAVTAMQEGAQNYIAKSTITSETLEHVIRVAIQHCAMQKRISEQRESLEIFARALAHDLKEPVRTILSLLGLVSDEGSFPEKAREHLQFIQKAAERMDALIEAVHFYTRLDAVEQSAGEICDANQLLEAAKENINRLILERGAVITCRHLPKIHVNRIQTIQVLQNLLCNAIQYCVAVPHIHVEAEEAADHWLFHVSDNGPGISEKDIEKLFKPFKQLSRRERQGLGLGLAICKKIVESHGGKIYFEPKSDAGATFAFTLPKAVPSAAAPAHSISHPLEKASDLGLARQVATMMMVDDNDIHIDLAHIMLVERPRLQCNVLVAHDGQEALDRLHDTRVDLMLLDINMPRMDGFELLEHMRTEKSFGRVAVVMCSTSNYDEDIARAKELGACGYLAKPPEFDQLKSIIENAVNLEMVEEDGSLTLLRAA